MEVYVANGQETGRRAVRGVFAVFLIAVLVTVGWWVFPWGAGGDDRDTTGAAHGVDRVVPTAPVIDDVLPRA